MRIPLVVVVCVSVALGAAATAYAQSTRRPDLNLFGRGLREPEQSLAVRANLGVTFYDRLGDPVLGQDGQALPDRGWGGFGSAALVYNLRLANVTFDGTIGSFASYYPNQPQRFRWKALPGAGARTGWNWALSDKTQLNVGVDLRFRPAYAESIVPGAAGGGGFLGSSAGGGFETGADANTAFLPQESLFIEGNYLTVRPSASLRHTLSRRWSLSASYDYERNKAFGVEQIQGLSLSAWRQNARAALNFAVTRNLSVRGGYGYEESHFEGTDDVYRVQGLDVGVDYGRGAVLQLARRTTLALNAGAGGYVDRSDQRRFRLTGDVALTHDFQRTWSSSVRYGRGIDSSQIIFREPILTDTFSAVVNGLFSRSLGGHASAVVQGGALAFGSPGRRTLRSAANAGLQTSLGQRFSVSVDYAYYYYRFDDAIVRPAGLPATSASQGVYAYISTWAPIFQRGGRSNASR